VPGSSWISRGINQQVCLSPASRSPERLLGYVDQIRMIYDVGHRDAQRRREAEIGPMAAWLGSQDG
jgi:hypothetical protein